MPARIGAPRASLFAALLVAASACGDDGGGPGDAGGDGGCGACDDGMFCNGAERCVDGVCSPGVEPCGLGTRCDEVLDRCETMCALGTDADGDGFDATLCGGEDCDDSNADRYPTNAEVCDLANLDEDCDPETFGDRDEDGDGYVDARCCNGTRCGDDCDDTNGGVHPGEAEVCNGLDDDCDGEVDEGVLVTFVVDADRDGHGSDAEGAATMEACVAPEGFAAAADDCDDGVASVHPGAYDRCDVGGVDDDCSGAANDPPGGCDCEDGDSRGCPLPGACGRSTQTCVAGAWAECAVMPIEEVCDNGLDDDCDGAIDDGCECAVDVRFCGTDEGVCERGIQRCVGAGSWGPCVDATEPQPETCNDEDDDCDGEVDEGVFVRCFADADGDGYTVPTVASMELCAARCPEGYTDRDPTDPALRDCAPADPRAYPGAGPQATPRVGVGGFDFDCDGTETATDTIVTSCVERADGSCMEPSSGLVARGVCGQRVTYIACDTIDGGSSGDSCEQVYSCPSTSTSCGDQNQVKCR
ncbi:MAG TPA: putative metal-binding motif-containing protein [Polyangiaceae bacterium LLY-WYZ-15_(1-7)]|nr:putative metal-binding motif-containing protein [Polyangiaceae bacterium LLY-WYZ-15_(1-7)]HJL10945.1 putative metal-binding motif-containing protein [Polyangiaceae bacterium LLY-WYZ-15_(1-7)]HJL27172.1 putative metal-binding motif-containing protein [Polyangiaceae bacterium LLY-WYZ-15_(1-7)]HJL35013.1 putative metal-binding motif-containing protein [Polyangiaceae bacterium LLY-WYZ-15_(1-7)]HJL47778.1 putative metal-binding motif-containing protein [Polyangiaceae bacterium LLY-WYZ-15_(1-7)]